MNIGESAPIFIFSIHDSVIRKRVSNNILNTDTIMAVDCLENAEKYPFVEKLKLLKKLFI